MNNCTVETHLKSNPSFAGRSHWRTTNITCHVNNSASLCMTLHESSAYSTQLLTRILSPQFFDAASMHHRSHCNLLIVFSSRTWARKYHLYFFYRLQPAVADLQSTLRVIFDLSAHWLADLFHKDCGLVIPWINILVAATQSWTARRTSQEDVSGFAYIFIATIIIIPFLKAEITCGLHNANCQSARTIFLSVVAAYRSSSA